MPSSASNYLKDLVGADVTITSGDRTPQRNRLVGGVPNSAHLKPGTAYDFVPKGMTTSEAAQRIAKSGKPFDQVIDENDHVHVSFDPQNRKQVIPSKMAGPSDSDILAALTGKSASAAPSAPQGGPSDDQLIAALTGGAKASAPASSKPKAAGKPTYMGQPFGFQQNLEASMPFGKDVAAAVPAGLDALIGRGSFGENYRNNLADLNTAQAGYEAENPGLANTSAGLGFFGAGGPAKAIGPIAKQTLGQLVKAGAKGGAQLGALFGLGDAGDGSGGVGGRLEGAATGAAFGAGAGAALPVLGAGTMAVGQQVGKVGNKLFPDALTVAGKKAKGIIESFAGGPVRPNATELVPGSKPTLAESTGNAGVAALTRALRDLNPNSPLVAREAENAAARGTHFEGAAGTPEDVAAALAARDKAATAQLKSVFTPGQAPADVTPIRQKIDEILAGSTGARPAVKASLRDVIAILDNEGKPVTDPKALYDSVRKGIGDLISGKDLTKAYGKAAARELIAVQDALDDVIEASAPGFKQYLDDYARASAPATAMEFLQGLNLTDAKGNITLAKVQNALKRLQAQQTAPGVKGGKAVTTAQQQALESIRDDLLRADAINKGKSLGSNTVQNALAQKRLGLSRFIPEGIGATTGAGIGGLVGGPHGIEIGGFIGDRLGAAVGSMRAGRQAQAQNMLQATIEDMLLNPGKYQQPMQGIPSKIRPLGELLNSTRFNTAVTGGNRLAVAGQPRSQEKSR